MSSMETMTTSQPMPLSVTPVSSASVTPRPYERETASPITGVDRPEFGIQRNRKYSSTGGGRAWTEEEEVYLLQTRLQKMPYKHIAAHLRKTELACRLHYHQLSHGTTRRKRAASVSSSASSGQSPVTPEQRMSPEVDFVTSAITPDTGSPIDVSHFQPWKSRPGSISTSPLSTQKSLPPLKPASQMPQVPLRFQAGKQSLRLDCTVATQPAVPAVNQDRLRQIYEAHRSGFWKMVAAEYGEGIDPTVLEESWKKGAMFSAATSDSTLKRRESYSAPSSHKLGPSAMSVLPPMQTERCFSPINRSVSASPALSMSARTLPSLSSTPTNPGSTLSGGPLPATAIASLLTDSVDTRRPSRLGSVSEHDTVMRDAQH
ncbi:MAG: hypothetical protein M1833_002190 [Piccolia ochrophora]|nr:MAG: hypothetical protein M1833_002190 [Piccolia ochrophora]